MNINISLCLCAYVPYTIGDKMDTPEGVENSTLNRRVKILNLIEEQDHIQIVKLSKLFNVSEVTIRNDLSHLEQKGLLIRTRGGAIKQQRVGLDFRLSEKASQHYAEKQRIGKKAREFVNNGDTIILDSGTTTLEIGKNLADFEELTVITNAINIAGHPGGFLRENSLSLVGTTAEDSLKNFYCDKVFMGVDGIDTSYGISTPNIEEAHFNRVMIEVANELIVVADSSKFYRRSFAFIAPISSISTLITDKNIPGEESNKLQTAGVKVITV
jgi:DeoR family transcriptional regulator of aga operon